MSPRGIFITDGSDKEAEEFIQKLAEKGTLTKLTAFKEKYVASLCNSVGPQKMYKLTYLQN